MANITDNRLNLVMTDPELASAVQHFTDLKTQMPFLVGLALGEKKEMQGINVSNKAWVEDCIIEMEQDPSILPGFLTPAMVTRDLKLFEQLDVVRVNAADFAAKVSDTQFLAGAEAYAVCLIYYKILEAAAKAGIAGAAERYNRLKARFENQGGTGTPTTPPSDGEPPVA
jgi:hypothetical protein